MMRPVARSLALFLVTFSLCRWNSTQAQIFYDNSEWDGVTVPKVYYNGLEYGDEVLLGGTVNDLGFYDGQTVAASAKGSATSLTGIDRVAHASPGLDVMFKLIVGDTGYDVVVPVVATHANTTIADFVSDVSNALATAGVPPEVTATQVAGQKLKMTDTAGRKLTVENTRSIVLTEFIFEYHGDFTPSGDETARFRLYKNDGPKNQQVAREPGTLLWDSGDFSISPGYRTAPLNGLSVAVPDDFTWTVQFSGLKGVAGDQAGLIFRNPPSVGSGFDDVWVRTGGDWDLYRWGGNPVASFGARAQSGEQLPTVLIQRQGNLIVVQWGGEYVLQVASRVEGPYTDIKEARNRWVFNPGTAPAQFWRLRQ